jgi:hypothetical protein
MKKFKVEVMRTEPRFIVVEVEAEDEFKAAEVALEKACDTDFYQYGSGSDPKYEVIFAEEAE